MGGGIVLSVLLIANRTVRPTGYLGGAANLLLLVGDFSIHLAVKLARR
jgi:hypothetical protein